MSKVSPLERKAREELRAEGDLDAQGDILGLGRQIVAMVRDLFWNVVAALTRKQEFNGVGEVQAKLEDDLRDLAMTDRVRVLEVFDKIAAWRYQELMSGGE